MSDSVEPGGEPQARYGSAAEEPTQAPDRDPEPVARRPWPAPGPDTAWWQSEETPGPQEVAAGRPASTPATGAARPPGAAPSPRPRRRPAGPREEPTVRPELRLAHSAAAGVRREPARDQREEAGEQPYARRDDGFPQWPPEPDDAPSVPDPTGPGELVSGATGPGELVSGATGPGELVSGAAAPGLPEPSERAEPSERREPRLIPPADIPPGAWPGPQMRAGRPARPHPAPVRQRRRGRPRRPLVGLAALLVLALLSSFFAWVSADPFWLALGHGDRGVATVVRCAGKGVAERCTGTFTANRADYTAERVALAALPESARRAGASVPARMVSARSHVAYAGPARALHPRWATGVALVLLCGLGIAWATGAGRLRTRRARVGAYLTSLGAPLLLLAGMLAAAW